MPRKVVDRDRGWKKMRARAKAVARQPGVTVGVHAREGARMHESETGKGAESVTVLEVAMVHEFGLGQEERSFVRAWFDATKGENLALAQMILRRILAGRITLEQGLEQLGLKLAGGIQQFIADNRVTPGDSEATKERKGSSVTLIDKGQLRQSLTYQVRK